MNTLEFYQQTYAILFKFNKLPLVSKLFWLLFSVPKQQSNTLHIGTHILNESSKDNTQSPNQTRYQLNSHLQSNTLELDDKAR
jgi:hypothetical protein